MGYCSEALNFAYNSTRPTLIIVTLSPVRNRHSVSHCSKALHIDLERILASSVVINLRNGVEEDQCFYAGLSLSSASLQSIYDSESKRNSRPTLISVTLSPVRNCLSVSHYSEALPSTIQPARINTVACGQRYKARDEKYTHSKMAEPTQPASLLNNDASTDINADAWHIGVWKQVGLLDAEQIKALCDALRSIVVLQDGQIGKAALGGGEDEMVIDDEELGSNDEDVGGSSGEEVDASVQAAQATVSGDDVEPNLQEGTETAGDSEPTAVETPEPVGDVRPIGPIAVETSEPALVDDERTHAIQKSTEHQGNSWSGWGTDGIARRDFEIGGFAIPVGLMDAADKARREESGDGGGGDEGPSGEASLVFPPDIAQNVEQRPQGPSREFFLDDRHRKRGWDADCDRILAQNFERIQALLRHDLSYGDIHTVLSGDLIPDLAATQHLLPFSRQHINKVLKYNKLSPLPDHISAFKDAFNYISSAPAIPAPLKPESFRRKMANSLKRWLAPTPEHALNVSRNWSWWLLTNRYHQLNKTVNPMMFDEEKCTIIKNPAYISTSERWKVFRQRIKNCFVPGEKKRLRRESKGKGKAKEQ